MSNYEVKYDIQVTTGNSVAAIQAFEQAVAPLTKTVQTFESLTKSLNRFAKAAQMMKPVTLKVNIAKGTEANLDKILNKIRLIRQESRTMVAGGSVGSGMVRGTTSRTYTPVRQTAVSAMRNFRTGNLSYKVLGPTPIDVNGVAAIDFLKGMGVAYGIAGAGQLVSSIIKNATEYDNLIQSTKNILQTHDKKGNFKQRFAAMEAVVRDVGVQTKFTAPEVADASKFLAMAGLDLDAIKTAIRPIADIALVGDTNLGETADVVTNIMTAYRMKPHQMRNAADVMTMTFTKSNTTLMEMAEAYKYSAALLSAGGIAFEESAGALGILGDAGIKGSQAGTTLRTIMANIVNPTKKQLGNWERIGVQRTGADGKVRPLKDIFQDLANAGLYVDDFYKLFHKTAAQGAVSLANSVEKWNEIIADNFLSDGLSKKLADEKKETLQGLWAQLTSAFTEDGMKGFGGIQETIKDQLRKGIAWLKTNEAVDLFKRGAKNFMEFGSMMLNSFRQIYGIFEKIGWAVKTYFKFQVFIYPLLSIVRALKSIASLGKSLLSLPRAVSNSMMRLGIVPMLASGGVAGGPMLMNPALAGGAKGIWGKVQQGFNYYTTGGLPMYVRPGTFSQDRFRIGLAARHDNDLAGVKKAMKLWNKQRLGLGAATGAVGLAAGLGIAAASDWSPTGWLAGGVPAVISAAMLGGPVGWMAAGAAALVFGGSAAFQAWRATKAAKRAFDEYIGSIRTYNGLWTGEGANAAMKALNLTYNKNVDLNMLISDRIALMRELLGLSSNNVDTTGVNISTSLIESRMKQFGAMRSGDRDNAVKNLINALNVPGLDFRAGMFSWRTHDGKYMELNNPEGWATGKGDVALMFAALAETAARGEEGKEIAERYTSLKQKALWNHSGLTAVRGISQEFLENYGNDALYNGWVDKNGVKHAPRVDLNSYPHTWNYTREQFDNFTGQDMSTKYPYLQTLQGIYMPLFGPNASFNSVAENYFAKKSAGTLGENDILEYIGEMDNRLGMFLKTYKDGNINAWFKELGVDLENGIIGRNGKWSASENAETLRGFADLMLKLFPTFTQEEQVKLQSFMRNIQFLRDLATGQAYNTETSGALKVGEYKDNAEFTSNSGETYVRRNGKWYAKHNPTLPPMTDAQVTAIRTSDNQTDTDTGNGNHTVKGNDSGYQNHYRSTTAVPKQIIINIDNLMNVEAIDMSKSDNSAVINNFKEQMSQALIEVVHDFAISSGNMI